MTGLPNNEMQRTKHGQDGASPLISVFDGQWRQSERELVDGRARPSRMRAWAVARLPALGSVGRGFVPRGARASRPLHAATWLWRRARQPSR